MVEFAGLDEIPSGLWPTTKDERIAAAVRLSGSLVWFGSEGLASVDVPVLLMHGGGEAITDPGILMGAPYESVGSERRAEVVFDYAGHTLFFSSCADSPTLAAIGFPMFCSDPVWEMDRGHDLINHFATAFLEAELKGDETAATALATENVAVTGVKYRETGYGAVVEMTATEPPHGIRFDAPPYAIDGPYSVGVRHFQIEATAQNERPLNGTVWYPALNSQGITPVYTYEMAVGPGQTPPWGITGHALPKAAADLTGGPYPLVVYSHAHTSFSQESPYLTEHLASLGFVVMAVDHEDNQFATLGQRPWQTEYQRADEVRRQIVYAETLTAEEGALAGAIDTESVGVIGASLGGGTALAAGGARLDLDNFRTLCESGSPEIQYYVLGADCVNVLENEAGLAALAGLDEVPDGLWPDWSDERVDAVVALMPTIAQFGVSGIQAVHAPTLLVRGLSDPLVGAHHAMYQPYENLQVDRKAEVAFENGGHMLFASACRDAADLVAMGFSFYCADPAWDMDRAHDLINHFTSAFLLAELKGDDEAAAALAAENVAFPGVEFQSQGFAPTASLDEVTIAEIESMVETAMAENKVPGMALAVVQGTEVVYAHGFGVASLDSNEPVTPETLFLWAETSFAPTAAAILQLVEQGLIDLDAPIAEYLPYFKLADERYTDITVRHILLHQSGLGDSGGAMADWATFLPQYDEEAAERYIRSLADRRLLFAPGSAMEASDIAYTILGNVIAKVSGQSYEAYMQEHILSPLGMDSSSFLMDEVDADLLAQPHILSNQSRVVAENYPYHRPFGPANNLLSSVLDMARFAQANLNGGTLDGVQILGEETHAQMWTDRIDTPYDGFPFGTAYPTSLIDEWGMGWFYSESAGHGIYTAFGREYGFQGQMILCPDANLVVIGVGNGEIMGGYYASDISTDVLGLLLAAQASE